MHFNNYRLFYADACFHYCFIHLVPFTCPTHCQWLFQWVLFHCRLFPVKTPANASTRLVWRQCPSLWQQLRSCWLTASSLRLHPLPVLREAPCSILHTKHQTASSEKGCWSDFGLLSTKKITDWNRGLSLIAHRIPRKIAELKNLAREESLPQVFGAELRFPSSKPTSFSWDN